MEEEMDLVGEKRLPGRRQGWGRAVSAEGQQIHCLKGGPIAKTITLHIILITDKKK